MSYSVKPHIVAIVALAIGFIFYSLATATSFTLLQFETSKLTPLLIYAATSMGGAATVGVGYASMMFIGGVSSLSIARLMGRITRSKQVIELIEPKSKSASGKVFERSYLAFTSALMFVFSLALGWDVFNADGPRASFLRPLLHAIDAFARPLKVSPVRYSLELIPILMVLVAIAGIVPSIALPYFRKFKVTGVNSSPFHTGLLSTLGGFLVGVGALATLIGFVYSVLWANKAPPSYHYVILVIVGMSIHYAVGTYLAREKSERLIWERLERESDSDNVLMGHIDVKPRSNA